MYVVVYAICKNESQFVERWMNSMSEADKIVVLDTGSSDDTVNRLRSKGAYVKEQKIIPWRFDTARNISLSLVPDDADICVCTDLDEVFDKGWRKSLEKVWKDGVTRANYRYTWRFTKEGKEGVVFWAEKIHSRHGYKWTHPVHEVLEWCGDGVQGNMVTAEGVQLNHYPDFSKPRSQYLPLLELSVKEDPDDDRNMHYLGREYMYNSMWDDCIKTLKLHLSMPKATWRDERAASMRYIAKSYLMKNDKNSAMNWYLQSIIEAPYLREPYVDTALMLYNENEWNGVLYFTDCALKISERPKTYICEEASWGGLPHDIRSIAFYNIGQYHEAVKEAEKALSFYPDNVRIKNNIDIIRNKIE